MAKHAFRDSLHLSKPNQDKLYIINDIIEDFQRQGYRMTLRQLYYQLVTKNIIPNEVKEYKKLTNLIAKGRMGGFIDWDAIEDRLRRPRLPSWVNNKQQALREAAKLYRMNRQRYQEFYIEVWCEKDALSAVLSRVTSHYHVRLMVNRGYTSVTAMHDAYMRMRHFLPDGNNYWNHKHNLILYLGDHDPSGLDMVRDIRDRLKEFGLRNLTVKHIALTWEQIGEHEPPPNPAKFTDPRSQWYMDKFGFDSWEVDALPPNILEQLLTDTIEKYIDREKFNKHLDEEEDDRNELLEIAEEYNS
jgi:hypothetical protein